MKVVQGNNYVMEEEMQLCLPIICIKQDPFMGNGQRNTTFWERISSFYSFFIVFDCWGLLEWQPGR